MSLECIVGAQCVSSKLVPRRNALQLLSVGHVIGVNSMFMFVIIAAMADSSVRLDAECDVSRRKSKRNSDVNRERTKTRHFRVHTLVSDNIAGYSHQMARRMVSASQLEQASTSIGSCIARQLGVSCFSSRFYCRLRNGVHSALGLLAESKGSRAHRFTWLSVGLRRCQR